MDYKLKAELVSKGKFKGLLKITFVYSPTFVNRVKTLSGRKYHGDYRPRFWTCPPSYENFEKLIEWGFKLDSKTKAYNDEMNNYHIKNNIDLSDHPALKGAYPFQKEGVEFLESKNGRALIADEMGLGKTVQALLYLKLHPELRPAVIVCPASLKLNWEKECYNWLEYEEDACVVAGKGRKTEEWEPNILIINYDILEAHLDGLISCRPKILILDESHYIKNTKAKRTKAVKKLAKKVDKVIGLTGTPIINKPIEFFGILNLLNPVEWPSYWSYAHKYCGAKHNGFGWDFNGATNLEELNKNIQRTMIRRTKEEVLPDLPAKIRTVIPIEIKNASNYKKAEQEFIGWMTEKEYLETHKKSALADTLSRLELLKQIAVSEKIDSCLSWIKDFLESDQKLVIFCTHRKTVDYLMNNLYEYQPVGIDGRTAVNKRQAIVEAFQTNPNIRVFVGNIKAAGVGLTLTAASSTCFVELGWTPGEHSQAEDRVHRIGQEADSVNAYYLLGQDTIETEIAELLDEKRKVLDAVLDGKETDETSLLTELMKRISGE